MKQEKRRLSLSARILACALAIIMLGATVFGVISYKAREIFSLAYFALQKHTILLPKYCALLVIEFCPQMKKNYS